MTRARAAEPAPLIPRRGANAPGPGPGRRPAAVERVVRELAGALGVRFSSLTVRADDESTGRVRARGAGGLAEGTTVFLDGARFAAGPPPLDRDAREVLAHELVHVAQRDEGGRPPSRYRRSAPAAEREARRLARRYVDGRPLPRPLATLPPDHLAADVGWAGLEELRAALDAFDDFVRGSRPHEWQTLQDAVSADGSVPEERVDLIVRTLAGVPLPVARALLRGLPARSRWDVVRGLGADHVEVHRPVVIAALASLDPAYLRRVEAGLLRRIDLSGLVSQVPCLERDLLLLALAGVPATVIAELLTGESGNPEAPRPWHELVRGEGVRTTPVRLIETSAAEQVAADHAAQSGHQQLTRQGHRLALGLAALITRDGAGAGEALTRISALEPELRRIVVGRLEDEGLVVALIDRLDPPGSQLSSPEFAALMAARPTAANLATIGDRLSGGIFGWDWSEDIAISEADALVAFWAIAALPLDVRERLLRSRDVRSSHRSDQGDVLDTIERNLPAWFVEGPAYRSLAVDRNRDGSLVERGARTEAAGTLPGMAAFLRRVRDLIGEGRTGDALTALDTGSPKDSAVRLDLTDDARAVLVDRLDALDVMDAFLEELPDEIRQGRDHQVGLLRVCTARSVPNLLRHLSSLLHRGPDDWAVTSREADLAYVLFRALPPYEQARYQRLGDITAEMSADARISSTTNLLDATTATARRQQVREQLGKDDVWQARSAGRLRALIVLAVALGEREFVFERSRKTEAWKNRALSDTVRDFQLYDEEAGRTTYSEQRLRDEPWYLGLGTLIAGLLWIALRDAAAGDFCFDPFGGSITHRDLDLRELGALSGGALGGARFPERRVTPRPGEPGPDVTERTNRAGMTFDRRAGTLHLSVPDLALEGLGLQRTTWAVTTGAIRMRELTVDATFDTSDLRYPRTIDLGAARASLSDLLLTTPRSGYTAGRIDLRSLHLTGSASTVPGHATNGRGAWTYVPVFGPLIEWISQLFTLIGLGVSGMDSLAMGMTELRGAHVTIGGVEIEGLLLGNTPIERVTVGPVDIGWGGTRAAYLQEQERALTARLARAPQGVRRDRLVTQLARVRQELPTALDEDRRLDELIRRSQRYPRSLTPSDHDTIRRLQRGPGGLVVDTGRIELTGVGDLAERATVERISGEVTATAITGDRLTDTALADRFAASGPPVAVVGSLDAAGGFDLGDSDITLQPPTEQRLRRWRQEADEAGGRNRVARLDVAIGLRGELDRLRAAQDARAASGRPASAADAARIEALLRLLATTIHLEEVSARFDATRGTIVLDAERVTGGPVEGSPVGLNRFDLEGVRVPIALDPGAVPALLLIPEQLEGLSDEARAQLYGERARSSVTGAGLSLRRAVLSDLRVGAGDSTVGEIVISDLRGGVLTPVAEGVRISGFHVGSIEGRGARIRRGAHSIDAPGGVAVEGVDASFTICLSEENAVRGARIDSASIATIRLLEPAAPDVVDASQPGTTQPGTTPAAPLSYTNLAGGYSVRLFDGALKGIWFQDVLLSSTEAGIDVRSAREPGGEGPEASDRPLGGIERIDGLRLAASVGGWRADTTISTPAGEGRTGGAITVGQARQGGWFLDLAGLRPAGTEIRSPDGSVLVRRLDLASSHLRFDDQGIYLDSLDIPLVEVGGLRWRIGSAGTLSSIGGATLRGITARARARLVERGGERRISEFVLPELRVRSITAQDLRYTDGPIDVRVRRLNPSDPAPAIIEDVVVTDVRWEPGKTTDFTVRTGFAAVAVDAGSGRPQAAVDDRDWGFVGRLWAGSLQVNRKGNDWAVGAGGLGSAGHAHVAGLGSTDLAVEGVDLPNLTFGADVISVPAGAAGMLRIRSLELSAMTFRAAGATISTPARSNVLLEDFSTALDIHLADVIQAVGPTKRTISSIVLHSVDAFCLSTSGLRIDVPGAFSTTLSTGGTRRSRVSGIHLRELELTAVPKRGGGWKLQMSSFAEIRIDHVDLHDLSFSAPLDVPLGADVPEPQRREQAKADYTQYLADKSKGLATAEDWVNAFRQIIDTARGTIHVDLTLPIYFRGVDLGGRITATIQIVNGEVSFSSLKRQICRKLHLADTVIDFVVRDRTLVLEFDPTKAGAVVLGIAGAALGALLREPLVTWDLSPGEAARARTTGLARVARLLVPRRTPPGSSPLPVEIDFGRMVLDRLDVDLDLRNEAPLTVTLPSGRGRLVFEANALQGLRIGIGAGIPGRPEPPPRVCAIIPPAQAAMTFSADRLALAGAALNLPIGTLTCGVMRVEDVRNGLLRLERLPMPETPTTPDRPHDTGPGLRLTRVEGNAGTVEIRDLVLVPGSPQ